MTNYPDAGGGLRLGTQSVLTSVVRTLALRKNGRGATAVVTDVFENDVQLDYCITPKQIYTF